jgi:competence protein ComEA
MVYVTGAVNKPEITVELPHNSRVMDAISAAGGLSSDANEVAINLAGILRDGDQVHVPSITDTNPDEPEAIATKSESDKSRDQVDG